MTQKRFWWVVTDDEHIELETGYQEFLDGPWWFPAFESCWREGDRVFETEIEAVEKALELSLEKQRELEDHICDLRARRNKLVGIVEEKE